NTEEASSGQSGAKLGSFATASPQNCNPTNFSVTGTGGVPGNPCTFPAWNNLVAVGLNHEGTYGPFNIQAYGGWEHGQLVSVPVPAAVGLFGDRDAYGAGADVGLFGFHFGADYTYDNHGSNLEKQEAWAVGLTYTMGPLTVGGSYMDNRKNRAA